MKLTLMFLTLTSLSIVAAEIEMPNLAEKGSANAGSNLVATCAACHGVDGNSINSDWPKLAGQNQKYTYEQLKLFQSGKRQNALMMAVTPYLNTLTDKNLLDIAAFYESNKTSVGQAKNEEDLLSLGMSLYRGGNLEKGIPACSACHSVYGNGLSLAGFPAIAGQQVGYLTSSLKAYRSNERNAGEYASVMQAVSQNLSDEDIDALANYMHGLYK